MRYFIVHWDSGDSYIWTQDRYGEYASYSQSGKFAEYNVFSSFESTIKKEEL